jgi:hypothetical protein
VREAFQKVESESGVMEKMEKWRNGEMVCIVATDMTYGLTGWMMDHGSW